MSQLDDLKKDAVNELKTWAEENYPDFDDYTDQIHEIADSSVPVYNATLLEIAGEDLWIACEEPEILAFDGTPTAVNCIAGVIYNELESAMHEAWDGIVEEIEAEQGEEADKENKDEESV